MRNKFYITTAIPYVNAAPHVGHALEFIQADVIARYHQLLNEEVLLLSGADENALKNVQAAEKAKTPIQKFVDKNANLFKDLAVKLNINFNIFQKGSDQTHHFPSSQELWRLCDKNGDIYKKPYEGLYCVGCEQFYNSEDLDENGECFEHPGKKLELIKEENYFFRLSKYQDQLTKLIQSDTIKIIPEKRKNEILGFLKNKLEDISISRTNERAKNWGVPVPNDPTQRIYVWFDALNIYQSGIGFGWDAKNYQKWWPADVHVIGKGILRFHAIYWPAFLISASLKLPKLIFVHEYFTVNGQKMSKTLGNVVEPASLIEKYKDYGGADSLRYYFLAKFSPFNDGDFSEEKFKEVYNADLANGLGNLVARVAKLCEINNVSNKISFTPELYQGYDQLMSDCQFNEVLKIVWDKIKGLDKYLDTRKPWEKSGLHEAVIWSELINGVRQIAYNLKPFLPKTSEIIENQFSQDKITSQTSLFKRLK